uniref:Uncharacterized protein n=1 Tax=Glossina brevipalpis TaxID=37001 RepID=A0A1A9WC23_9MUSC
MALIGYLKFKRDLWSDFLTYLLDDSDESVDNNRNDDDKYLICRNCEVIVTASEGVDQKPGIVEERKKPCMNTEMKPEDKKPAEALENKENNDDET